MKYKHIPVLLNEVINYLNIKNNGIYVDATLGLGGHSLEILKHLRGNSKLIAIDRDIEAINNSKKILKNYKDKTIYINDNFCNIKKILRKLNIDKIDGAILDLGVSSYQLDNKKRGFSYIGNNPLDMRMDKFNKITAKYVVNNYTKQQLSEIIKNYGEDRFANNIAKHIINYRENKIIETTDELVKIVLAAIPLKVRKVIKHPEKRVFQAIRIEVNKELELLNESLDNFIDKLNLQGRLCVISFHSLEDRIVKENFKINSGKYGEKDFFGNIDNKLIRGDIITKKPIIPKKEEIILNRRAHSAKLRVFERK